MTPAQQLRRDIETCELPHPMFMEHLTALKRRIDDALAGFAPKIVRVPGPSGVGKSSLIANLSRSYPMYRIDGRRHVPVLVVEVPTAATAKLLPKSVLRALGIQVPGSMTADAMFDMMVTQLRLAGTRVVIFDEVSHLVDEGSRVPPRAASDWLKALTDKLEMTLILFGIPRLERLFSANEQLRRRACPALNFLPYDATDADQMTAYISCVVSYAGLFSAAGYPINVPARVLTQQCYLLTGGLIGVVSDFMRELASVMKNEAPRAITYADCQKAVESVSHAGSPHRLAFPDAGIDGADVEPAALKQAFVHVLTSNAASVPVRKKTGDKQ
ncbi:TniB family NTP-binding protein [Paraburkholderia sediminicola]